MVSTNKIRLASDLDFDSIVDGPGLRIVVWTQGCPHNCVGCHNPQTHDSNGGEWYDVAQIIEKIENSKLQSGVTLSGGEPFMQPEALLPIVQAAKAKGLNVWSYTGFTYEQLLENPSCLALLSCLDVLVDGRFEIDKKDFRLWYKGSSNQRIIDVQASLQQQKIVLSEYEKENEAIKRT